MFCFVLVLLSYPKKGTFNSLRFLLIYAFLFHKVLRKIILWHIEGKKNYYYMLKLNICVIESQWFHSKNRNKRNGYSNLTCVNPVHVNISVHQNNISSLNNPLYYAKTHYIMHKSTISYRNSLYHSDTLTISFKHTHYFIQKFTISFRNTLCHAETHYIIQTLIISSRNSLYHLDTHYIMEKLNHFGCVLFNLLDLNLLELI